MNVNVPRIGDAVTITIGDGRQWTGIVDKRYGGKITLRRLDAHWTTTIYEADITNCERLGARERAADSDPAAVGSGGSAQCEPAWEQEGAPASNESLLVRRLRALAAHLGYVEPEDDPPGHSEDTE